MGKVIRNTTSARQKIRAGRKIRIHKKILRQKGLVSRLVIYRSNKFIYAQVIDDLKGHTLAKADTQEKDFEKLSSKKNIEAAKELGKLVGKRALEQKVERILFDRNGYDYHGRIQAVAEGAREAGLQF